jgi:hypothetical protein
VATAAIAPIARGEILFSFSLAFLLFDLYLVFLFSSSVSIWLSLFSFFVFFLLFISKLTFNNVNSISPLFSTTL